MAAFLAMVSHGNAADRFFEGRWQASDKAHTSIGIIQYGDTIEIFSEAGFATGFLQSASGGSLGSGQGKWTLNAGTAPVVVNVTIAYHDGSLHLLIVPKEERSRKLILRRVEPPANRRIRLI